jgi:hypothetical protein
MKRDYIEQLSYDQKQESYLNRLEYLLKSINKARWETGKDPKNKLIIDSEIMETSDKLNKKNYDIFVNMLDR